MDDLIKYRISSAEEKLVSAKALLDIGQYKDSIGRSYYAFFAAMRAVLAIRQIDFKKHSAVISYFQKEYIKTQELDVKYAKYIQQAFQVRNSCDYDDFFIATRTDAEEQYQRATEFLDAVKKYIDSVLNG